LVFNADGRRESRELIDRLKNSDTFHIRRYVQTDRDLNDEIIAGRARVGIKSRSIILIASCTRLARRSSFSSTALILPWPASINVTTAIGLDESLRRVLQDRTQMAVEMRPKLLFNPDSRSPNFFLPGLTAVLLLNVTTFLTAFSIVREKERGTLEQLFVTPVRPLGLLLGKLLPYLPSALPSSVPSSPSCARLSSSYPWQRLAARLFSLPYLFVSLSIAFSSPVKPIRSPKPFSSPSSLSSPAFSFRATFSLAKPCRNSSSSSATLFPPAITSTSRAASYCAALASLICGRRPRTFSPWAPSSWSSQLRRFQKKVIMA